jgi:hypothetical protein
VKPYYDQDGITIYHGDCREVLPSLQRAYGIGKDGGRLSTGSHGGRKAYEFKGWDSATPPREVFELMFAKSTHQIIWGANYFCSHLPPTMGWIFWDKAQRICGSDGELAFTSFDVALRVFEMNRVEIAMDGAVHPTQKPLRLMTRCILYADKHGQAKTILDPFAGSGTTLVAAKEMGRRAIGIETEERYCEIAANRLAQGVLFGAGEKPKAAELVA